MKYETDAPASTSHTNLEFHPLADVFPLMVGEEFAELVADIKANGLRQQIVLHEGKIIDGRNRYRACIEAGVEPAVIVGDDWINDPAAYVISANIHPRHLTAEQKRDLIIKCADWTKSDRAIAADFDTNKNTVGRARKEIERKATVPTGTVGKRVGKDGKARKQPAKRDLEKERRARAVRKLQGRDGLPSAEEITNADDDKLEEIFSAQAMIDRLREDLRTAEIKIVALESENAELEGENAALRGKLEAAQAATTEGKPATAPKKRGRPKGSKNKPKMPTRRAA